MINYIITDFDGTLVDTKLANLLAYKEAFNLTGLILNDDNYLRSFGLRFDALCDSLNVDTDLRQKVKETKALVYPKYFDKITLNKPLLNFIIHSATTENNVRTAIASTASKNNLFAVLKHFNIENIWDVIITGEDVNNGKPDPEVYNLAVDKLCDGEIDRNEILVFEDSDVGIASAENAGLYNIMKICL